LFQKTVLQNNNQAKESNKGERQLGKYEGKIQMAEDFNKPMDDFKDYMQ